MMYMVKIVFAHLGNVWEDLMKIELNGNKLVEEVIMQSCEGWSAATAISITWLLRPWLQKSYLKNSYKYVRVIHIIFHT